MPTYRFYCKCNNDVDVVRTMAERDDIMMCGLCGKQMTRQTVYAVAAKFPGRVLDGGGPDRFTADVLGYRLKDLPDSLRTEK